MNVKKVAIMNNLQEDEEVLCDITGDVSEQEESFVDDTNGYHNQLFEHIKFHLYLKI